MDFFSRLITIFFISVIALFPLSGCSQRPAKSPDALIDRFDKNNDGGLSRDEIPQRAAKLLRAFDLIDADKNGVITSAEFNAARDRQSGRPATLPSGQPAPSTLPPQAGNVVELMSSEGMFIDPELIPELGLMTYQDEQNRIWLDQLDRSSGLRKTDSAFPILVDSNAANLRDTYNGPEFGVDKQGYRIFYSKPYQQQFQIWQAQPKNAGYFSATAVFKDGERRQSVLASKDANASDIRIIYLKGSLRGGDFYWTSLANPSKEQRIMPLKGVDSPRWINNTQSFVYAETQGSSKGQLTLVDTVSGTSEVISNDAGEKSYTYGWHAPEFDGELLVMAMVDGTAIGIYRDLGGPYWTRISTLNVPEASAYPYFGSPEPFVANGRSYISAVTKSSRGKKRQSEVWILCIGTNDSNKTQQRVDSGGAAALRSDPETLVYEDKVHVYFNHYDPGKGQRIRLAADIFNAQNTGVSHSEDLGYTAVADAYNYRVSELNWHDQARNRRFFSTAYLPQAIEAKEKFPLVIFSHGMGGSHENNAYLGEYWARHGYITIMMDHPGSNIDIFRENGPRALGQAMLDLRHVEYRVGDVKFVLDNLLNKTSSYDELESRIDDKRIAMTGHSYGAMTTMSLIGLKFDYFGNEADFNDDRFDVAIAMGPQGTDDRFFNLHSNSWDAIDMPVMTMTGTLDGGSSGQNYTWRNDPFKYMPSGDKYNVVIENAGHNSFYDHEPLLPRGKPKRDPRHFSWIQQTSTAFLDAYLKDNVEAKRWLEQEQATTNTNGEIAIDQK